GDSVRVNGISFTVDQPEQFLTQARDEAVKNARARAEVLAKAAGVTLGAARSVTESTNGGPVPFPERAMAAPAVGGAATPINPGEQTLTLTVNVTYNISSGS
ncbi:MAG: SIMPL domain-containing protein, partial [Dehalococcoidia bacterium]